MFSHQVQSPVAVLIFATIYQLLYSSITGPATFSHLMETSLNGKATSICVGVLLLAETVGLLLSRLLVDLTDFTATCVVLNLVLIVNIVYVKTSIKEWHFGYSVKQETQVVLNFVQKH